MKNDDDFTFCQVGASVSQDGLGPKNRALDIGINVEDRLPNGTDSGQTSSVLWKGGISNNAASEKEETVGSLSFNVIDAGSLKRSNDLPEKVASLDVGTKSSNLQERKSPPAIKKPAARAKVPFEKGYSQMDWLKLTRTHPDLADVGTKSSNLQERKSPPAIKKPAARAKVPFEKGYSQMDWLKLTRTHPDLAGLKGQSNMRRISMNEVKQHNLEGSMWTVLKGRVYNFSPYMRFHPGGVDMLMKAVAKDCTSLFNKYHAWVNDEFLLEKCLVGILDDGH